MGKLVLIGSDAQNKLENGVNILANAVKATLGPRGRHVAIQRKSGGPPIITKDGVTVARYIDLNDPVENMGAQLVKSVASDANFEAGDGTTTATVLAQEIYTRGLNLVKKGFNPVLLKRGIDLGTTLAVEKLKKASVEVQNEEVLFHVATISANNDQKLGKMIAEAVINVGENGIVSIEEASGNVTEIQYEEGMKFERGWLSENFITNSAKNTCEMQDPYVLLVDDSIKSIYSLVGILNKVIESGQPILLIVKNIEVEALSHLVLNKINNTVRCCVIKAPGFGDLRKAYLDDIALQTGATVFSNVGLKLEDADLKHLGRARSVSIGLNNTKMLFGTTHAKVVAETIQMMIEQLKDPSLFEEQKLVLASRIARLSGGAAIFKVGATSESELREKKDRVEDAVNAVRSAIAEGVVAGGGSIFLHCLINENDFAGLDLLPEEKAGIELVNEAIQVPFKQILINAGSESLIPDLMKKIKGQEKAGFDALKLEFVEDMFARGIIDPVKVIRSSLEHAASASGILLTTEVTISELQNGG